jgi:hypothetical protein
MAHPATSKEVPVRGLHVRRERVTESLRENSGGSRMAHRARMPCAVVIRSLSSHHQTDRWRPAPWLDKGCRGQSTITSSLERTSVMNKGEPPSQCLARYCPMLVGRNGRGHWVVRSQDGLCGGLFVNRAEALRFALFENGHRPDTVILVTGNLELALTEPLDVAATSAPLGKADLSNRSESASTPRPLISSKRHLPRLPAVA